MKIRRFSGPDMRQAIRRVRDELGAEAVILSSHTVDDGVEIVAAIDYRESEQAPQVEIPALLNGAASSSATAAGSASSGEIRREMQAMRHLLESHLAQLAWNEQARRTPIQAQAMRNLASLGLSPDLVDQIVASCDALESYDDAWRVPLARLIERIPVTDSDLVEDGGVLALVGPTGAGKTTAIAKLAARHTLRHGPGQVALVAADDYRIGARAQLTAFGEIIGAPVFVAADGAELKRVLDSLLGVHLVLVDTTGVGHRDVRMSSQLAALAGQDFPVRHLLTLPANAQIQSLQETIEAFAPLGLSGCVMTKIDDAVVLGGALAAVIRSELPLAYLSNGQRVPEDIWYAGPRREWLLKAAAERIQAGRYNLDEAQMAAQFSRENVHERA
ncbi:MAG: flagellar biosynthesis protein FlhF [Gammaproteobacteria bacterium]